MIKSTLFTKSVITLPLWERLLAEQKKTGSTKKKKAKEADKNREPLWYDIIITANRRYQTSSSEGIKAAHDRIETLINELKEKESSGKDKTEVSKFLTNEHLYARLKAKTILELVDADQKNKPMQERAIHQIWPDFEMSALLNETIYTINRDDKTVASPARFKESSVFGSNITWAVLDSGIHSAIAPLELFEANNKQLTSDMGHRHFFNNVMHANPDYHRDFTIRGSQNGRQPEEAPFTDTSGHGTHVAGIIAGSAVNKIGANGTGINNHAFYAFKRELVLKKADDDVAIEQGRSVVYNEEKVTELMGIAPACTLVSLKIMSGPDDTGSTRSVLAAITHILKCNRENPTARIHGINLSAGYTFDKTWYGCGHSPLCEQLTKLVEENVVVVVAAGNSQNPMTIMDPGNAELVITVGSTHRTNPQKYGITYTSSKGPTIDGRPKPDLVAPGEKIISCATGMLKANAERKIRKTSPAGSPPPWVDYVENSGTSMAAPHVSGAIAAFLSKRTEYIDKPEEVKRIFMETACKLNRDVNWEGAGLIDLRKAIAYSKKAEKPSPEPVK